MTFPCFLLPFINHSPALFRKDSSCRVTFRLSIVYLYFSCLSLILQILFWFNLRGVTNFRKPEITVLYGHFSGSGALIYPVYLLFFNSLRSLRLTADIRCVAPRALLGSRTLRGTFRFAPFFHYARTWRKFGRFRRRRAGTCLTKSGLRPDFVYPSSLAAIGRAKLGRQK